MKFMAFVVTDGPQPEESVAVMNRDFPAYFEEMEPRGVRLLGRELDLPEAAVTVRVRHGETLVSDGPFAETKEFLGGFDVLQCRDLDEAIEVEAKSPVAQFLPFEIRPLSDDLFLGPGLSAFASGDDSAGIPHMLIAWAQGPLTGRGEVDRRGEVDGRYDAWRQDAVARGAFILGGGLSGPESATTLRVHDGELRILDGPFLDAEQWIAGIDVVWASDREAAVELAASHPLARDGAIEVRPCWSE